MFSRWPLHRQILLLVAVLVLPLVGLLVYGAWDRVQLRRIESEQTVSAVAELAANSVGGFAQNTASMLATASRLTAIQHFVTGICAPMVSTVRGGTGIYANAVVYDRRGRLMCNAFAEGHALESVARMPWFREASATSGFHISRPYVNPMTGRWVVMFSQAIEDENGRVAGYFGLSVDLLQLSAMFSSVNHSPEYVINVINEHGDIIARSSDAASWVGRNVEGSTILEPVDRESGVLEARGVDNVLRIYAVNSLEFPAWSVRVGVPSAAVTGPVARQLVVGGTVTVIATLFAIAIAVLLAARILKPLRELVSLMARSPEMVDSTLFGRRSAPEIASIAAEFSHVLAARREAEQREHLLAKVFEEAEEAMMITDSERRLIAVNRAFENDTGFGADEVIGQNPSLLRSGRHDRQFYRKLNETLESTGRWNGEIWNRRKSGEIFPCYQTISKMRDEQGSVFYVGIMLDITRQKALERELEYLAYHDPLTDLPNRYLLTDRLRQAIQRNRQQPGNILAVLHVDLDRFKYFNDTLGHPAGDALLAQVAQRLRTAVRDSDTVARQGGDEFTIILADIATREDLLACVRKLFDAMNTPFQADGRELTVSISMGVCVHPGDAQDVTGLLRHADAAMYRAKAEGGNRYAFYTETLTEIAERRFSLEHDLRDALARNEFSLVFEPQYSGDAKLVGCEALLRWQHPAGEPIGPGEFVPLLVEIGLINEVTEWVIEQACTQLAQWRADGLQLPHISINLSAARLEESDLAVMLADATQRHGLEPSDIELEITESALMRRPEEIRGMLAGLYRLGVRIAIDDFGTGYSSLAYLRLFDVDVIKIDRSFVTDVDRDEGKQEIVRAIVALGRALGMEVLAEGVETEGEYDCLKEAGCQLYQGFLFTRPLDAESFGRL